MIGNHQNYRISATKVCIFFVLDTGCWNRPVEWTNLEQSDGSFVFSLFWLGFLFIFASSREWNQQGRYMKHRWYQRQLQTQWKLTSVCSCLQVVYFTALFPYVILIALLVNNAQLPGALDGIKFFIVPQWQRLLSVEVRKWHWVRQIYVHWWSLLTVIEDGGRTSPCAAGVGERCCSDL